MLESKNTQFTLSPEGKILWQEKLNNPLPGVEVATLQKGDHPLRPRIVISQTAQTQNLDAEKIQGLFSIWLNQYMTSVLEPLMLLGIKGEVQAEDPFQGIIDAVYDSLGIIPREKIESLIGKITPENRAALRAKKIRLGPILVFIPALNKPAAVRLRGLLWCLFHGQPLPAKVPADGIVSQKIEDGEGKEDFYRSIGYPLYGGRAVRIDMLDRVISSIYDGAKDGVFQAQHQMAEWLGAPIDDLYKILEAMGHKKIEEPVVEMQELAVPPVVDVTEVEVSTVEIASETEKKVEVVKPALAKFRLKRGKAFESRSERVRKPFTPRPAREEGQTQKPHRKEFKQKDKSRDAEDKPFKKHKAKPDRKERRESQVVMLEAKKRDEDSPFAILQKLVVKSDG